MSRVYDNWERLVEATLKRELHREIALCPSLSSSTSIDLSSRFDSLDHVTDRSSSSSTGTFGNIAPESETTDVFGYGVMLLELITGQRAFDLARLANDDDVMLLDWVKGLLKKKKLETLVDPDLRGNYINEEVQQLIHLSEVVRMLEGDGLAERWEEWQKEEIFRQDEFNHSYQPNTNWTITDDTIRPVELSGPR